MDRDHELDNAGPKTVDGGFLGSLNPGFVQMCRPPWVRCVRRRRISRESTRPPGDHFSFRSRRWELFDSGLVLRSVCVWLVRVLVRFHSAASSYWWHGTLTVDRCRSCVLHVPHVPTGSSCTSGLHTRVQDPMHQGVGPRKTPFANGSVRTSSTHSDDKAMPRTGATRLFRGSCGRSRRSDADYVR